LILEAVELAKHYGKPGKAGVRAVDGVSFAVREGQCFGLLGPNGAGKSTTIEMLEGILAPSAGSIRYRGEPLDARHRQRIGIQFQSTALQDFLTVRENLRFFGALYEKNTPHDQLISVCRLKDFLDRDASKLSGGQRQRLLLAIALVGDPEFIFLDEPTTGLDPQARRNFWDLVETIKRQGKTILLTTHYMEEAYVLCDEIAIMDHGKIIARGSPQSLLAEHFSDVVVELPVEALPEHAWPFEIIRTNGLAEIMTADVNGVLRTLLEQGVSLAQLRVRPRTLEDLFLQLTGKELRA
jgi:ABC-2 type transport system ATP-binding protein